MPDPGEGPYYCKTCRDKFDYEVLTFVGGDGYCDVCLQQLAEDGLQNRQMPGSDIDNGDYLHANIEPEGVILDGGLRCGICKHYSTLRGEGSFVSQAVGNLRVVFQKAGWVSGHILGNDTTLCPACVLKIKERKIDIRTHVKCPHCECLTDPAAECMNCANAGIVESDHHPGRRRI